MLAAVLLGVAAGLWLAGWRVSVTTFVTSDVASYFAPKFAYGAERIARGSLPLWNPFELCGIPFLATLQPGVLYPPQRLVYAVLGGDAAYMAFFFLHLAIGAAGTLVLMRSFGAGMWPSVFAATWVVQPCWLLRIYEHPQLFAGIAWLPFVVLATRRIVLHPSARLAAFLAVVLGIQALVSYPPISIATAYVIVLGLPFWWLEAGRPGSGRLLRSGAVLAGGTLLALALVAVQLLPAAELLAHSNRAADAEQMRATMVEMGTRYPYLLHMMNVPQASFAAATVQLWKEAGPILVGLGVVALALGSLARAWWAVALIVLSALVPLPWLFHLPLARFVRFFAEWNVIFPLAIYALAGQGLDAGFTRRAVRPRTAAAATTLLVALVAAWNWQHVPKGWLAPRSISAPALPPGIADACDLDGGRFRLFWPLGQTRGGLLPARLPSVGGYEGSLAPARVDRLADGVGAGNGPPSSNWAETLAPHRAAASRMALRCIVAEAPMPALHAAGFVAHAVPGAPETIYENRDAVPRARLVFETRAARSEAEALDLALGDVDPHRAVVLEGTPADLPACAASRDGASAAIVEDEPESVRVRVTTPCAGYLVLADTYFPGWSAHVDGAVVPIALADYAFRAVLVPAGTHDVLFLYRPRSVTAGVAVSLVGAIAVIVAGAWPRARDPFRGARS